MASSGKLSSAETLKADSSNTTSDKGGDGISESDFVKIIGLVEDILVDEDFQTKHNDYCSANWKYFSEDENPPMASSELEKQTQNRFNIFRTYSIEMAAFIESALRRSLGDDFEIQGLILEIESRTQLAEFTKAQEQDKDNSSERDNNSGSGSPWGGGGLSLEGADLDGEIVDMLLTLKDYGRFQELMVDYSKMMQGKTADMDGLVSLRRISDDEADKL